MAASIMEITRTRHWKGFLRKHRLRDEVVRLALSILWFLGCAFLMAIVQLNGDAIHARAVAAQGLEVKSSFSILPIVDFVFERFSKVPRESWFNPDVSLHSFIIVSALAAMIHWPLLILIRKVRRFFWLYGFGYFLRMFTLAFTVLPPSDPLCIPLDRTWLETVFVTPALLFGRAHTCTDKIFSGHTVVATLLFWSWIEARTAAGDWKLSFWKLYPFVHFAIMVISSLMGHNHYTVDIVVAFIVNTLTFACYTLVVSISIFQQNETASIVDENFPSFIISLLYWCDGADLALRVEKYQPPQEVNMMEAMV